MRPAKGEADLERTDFGENREKGAENRICVRYEKNGVKSR